MRLNLRFGPEGALYVGTGDADLLPGGLLDPASWVGAISPGRPGSRDELFRRSSTVPGEQHLQDLGHGLCNPYRFSFDPVGPA